MTKPKYSKGEVVSFKEQGKLWTGEIVNVDYGGALGHNEHTYDVYKPDAEIVIWKHVDESAIICE